MPRTAAMLSLVAAMSFTGANVPFGKAIVLQVPIYVVLALRFAVAGLALALIVGREPGPRLVDLPSRQWGDITILAVVGTVLFTAFILAGTQRTSAVDAGIITATIPAVAALLGLLLFRRRPGLGQALLIALAVCGVAVMQVAQASGGHGGAAPSSPISSLTGNALVGLAVLCEAIFVVVSQRMSVTIQPIRLSLAVVLISLGLSLPLAAATWGAFDPRSVPLGVWGVGLWYALSSSVFCPILWYRGAPHVEPWQAGLATAAVPVSAVAISAVFLGEPVSWAQTAGATLVIAAITCGALADDRGGGSR